MDRWRDGRLPGVTIGDRTIIGAGSVVTKSIPSDVVAAGNPLPDHQEPEGEKISVLPNY